MLITKEIADRVKVKRALTDTTKSSLQTLWGISYQTMAQVEKGDYDAPRRVYDKVMELLADDC